MIITYIDFLNSQTKTVNFFKDKRKRMSTSNMVFIEYVLKKVENY